MKESLPKTNLSHYRIVKQIGAGGMGEVFLAEDPKLERRVALKVLPDEFAQDAERLRRFVQEAKAASALNHPNILTIYEIGAANNSRFIASEFIEGETLREKINSKSLDLTEILEIAVQIASALCAAHEAKIIHRDIKPENIIVREDGLVKVLDFGLAKLSEPPAPTSGDEEAENRTQVQTQAGMIMGTAAYMSPEQADGKAVDTRTDIFSFGVVLYEMLTRRQPFTGDTIIHKIIAILEKEPPPLSDFVKDYPSEIERIIFRTLAKNADERYQSAKDLLTDLKSLQKRLEFEAELNREGEKRRRGKGYGNLTVSLVRYLPFSPSQLPPNNLAENLASIIGREKKIAEIKNLLLQTNVRLVTMTGIGGTGKTTLAQAVAQEVLTNFKDGVFFVELAAITNPELVTSTIAQPLGVKEAGGKPILEILKDYLSDKQMLLVVDNFEQVVDAAPNIAELIAATSWLKILITSRVLLRLSAEREFVVPPLEMPSKNLFDDYPPATAEPSSDLLDELSNYEAIRLFVERAQNAKSNFALREENARSVAEICARLDGLPLAIELAAARVKILSPNAILAKLENRLKFLTGGARDLPARQQTMRGAVEWSYDLLNEDEKTLFRRLAVFAGGFTFEAAEAVVEEEKGRKGEEEIVSDKQSGSLSPHLLISFSILDGITSLADKSLLVAKEQSDGEMRFRMLEVVHEYALETLEKSGEAEAMRRSHTAYFLALGEEAEPHLQAAQSAEWLNRLEDEHDNLRDALAWLFENDAVKAARLAGAIRFFWTYHGHLAEGRKWLKAALERGSIDVPAAVRFKLLNGLGLLARNQGDFETAWKAYEKGLEAGRAANDLRQIALSSEGLGVMAYLRDDFTAARKFYEEGLAISRELDDKSGIAIALSFLGDLARAEGDNAAARPLLEESLVIVRQLGNKQNVSNNLNNLGSVVYGEGDFAAARIHFAEALATAQELGDKRTISCSLDGFAALVVVSGESERAAQLSGAAEHLRESIGYEIEPAERRFRDAYLAELKTNMDEAAFVKFYEQGCKLKLDEAIQMALDETVS